ncbi:DeoR/GlpR family DNA-binding transcription regulator [Microbacterium sp. ET2]|uniref:DeoR/GlpR family DNA-binding transcription regulator n=1 Tax=Microbacterium albipurpureum TaxID=3050384 RepID=UPI00259D1549|nr:DeoR/GlpR family DNA-binding transcription regulator [Microbacterium sp. ET2 (Ac-2212)]WJL96993.1 DeoR/GlpR family DNA-binding transcription regulator [Microbacterium sp. ET2 (Ac-2212)]
MATAAGAISRAARQRIILDHVLRVGSATAAELIELTGRSAMTVHRDLEDLAARNLVRKFHGGVSALPTSVFESSSEFRLLRRTEEKVALAKVAISFVEPGMSLMLDDSTTVLALGQLLSASAPLTVVTNYCQVLSLLKEAADVHLIMIGGAYSRTHDSFIAPPDQTNLEAYAVDIAFQSTSTMDDRLTYHQEQDIVTMKRAMLQSGRRRVLMMDGSKVGHTSLHRYLPISEFTDVILTEDVEPRVRERIADHATVHVASLSSR